MPEVRVLAAAARAPPAGAGAASTLPAGAAVASTLPGGLIATTVHRGDYALLDDAHRAVRAWCAEHGHDLAGPRSESTATGARTRPGLRWEVYGHWREDPAELETEVSYLLR